MKLTVKNYHIIQVLDLLSELGVQRMLIGDKIKIKENFEKILKKNATIEEMRVEIILSNGGTKEEGIKADHENYPKVIAELNELFNVDTEISIQTIPMDILIRFEVSEKITLESVEILAGTFKLTEVDQEAKEIELQPE